MFHEVVSGNVMVLGIITALGSIAPLFSHKLFSAKGELLRDSFAKVPYLLDSHIIP